MTVSTTVSSVSYLANGTQTTFAYTFKIFEDADLLVILRNNTTGVETTQTLTTDYTVTNAGNDAGGNVVFGTAPASGNTVFIRRVLDATQTTDYVENDPFPAESHEDALDKLTMLIQQGALDEDRAILFPESDAGAGLNNVLPSSVARASSFLTFDGGGNVTVTSVSDPSAPSTITKQNFTGDGSTVAFTLAADPGGAGTGVSIYIDGVYQNRDTYTISGTSLTFTEAPPLNASVEYLSYRITNIGATTADAVTYTPSGTGAEARSVASKLGEFVSVKDFGAVGDGVTDDTAEIQAALTAAIAAGKSLFIPAGTYYVSSAITASTSTNACSIVGEGPSNTRLVWTTGAGGLSITYSDSIRPPFVSDLSLLTATSGSGTALTITGPDSASVIQYGPIVQRLQIQGGDLANDCWDTGIDFVKCWYPKIEDININGLNEYGPTFVSSAGIKLTSCQVCYFNHFNIFHVDNGILEVAGTGIDHGEGFTFCNFEIVGVGTGISLTAEQVAPGTNIGPGHVNAFNYGIKLANQFQTSVHNMLIYKTDDLTGTPQSFVGIEMYDCRSNRVHDNIIHGFKAANLVGISMTGSVSALTDFNHVHDNLFYLFGDSAGNKIGLLVGTGTGNSLFHHNYADSTVTTPISLSAGIEATNKFDNNYPVNDQGFADGDATPSIANALSGVFLTGNTGATTITSFDDAYQGQEITILANDGNTTIQHSASIVLAGGVNFVMSAGDILRLRFIGSTTVAREVSRTEV